MKCGVPIDYLKLRQYKRLAHEVIRDGGNITELARRADVSLAFMSRYMKKHAPHLHRELKAARSNRVIAPEVILYRLRVIDGSRNQKSAARRLNLSENAISYFLRQYAPDGVKDALELYGDTEETLGRAA